MPEPSAGEKTLPASPLKRQRAREEGRVARSQDLCAAFAMFAALFALRYFGMPMLRRLMELGCTLIDYERVTDDANRRLIFFGVHAGHAGMIETLRALGLRLEAMRPLMREQRTGHTHDVNPQQRVNTVVPLQDSPVKGSVLADDQLVAPVVLT